MKKILTPIIIILTVYGLSYFFKNDIIDIYIKYTTKINSPEETLLSLNNLKNENEYLKNIIKNATSTNTFSESGVIDLIAAQSSFLDKGGLIYGDIILNKGYDSGVKKDSLVYISGLRPIGIIKNVNQKHSILEIFTSNKKELEVFVKDVNNASTTNDNIFFSLTGDGSYGFYTRLLKSLPVKTGQDVYIKNYPSLKIGQILEVEDIKNENEKIIYVKSNFTRNSENIFYIEN